MRLQTLCKKACNPALKLAETATQVPTVKTSRNGFGGINKRTKHSPIYIKGQLRCPFSCLNFATLYTPILAFSWNSSCPSCLLFVFLVNLTVRSGFTKNTRETRRTRRIRLIYIRSSWNSHQNIDQCK